MKTVEELAQELQSPSGIGWQESIRLIESRDAEIHALYAPVVEALEKIAAMPLHWDATQRANASRVLAKNTLAAIKEVKG